jgi:hypothetical protein
VLRRGTETCLYEDENPGLAALGQIAQIIHMPPQNGFDVLD